MRYFKIKFSAPFLTRGNTYGLDDETGEVFRVEGNVVFSQPLRTELAQYLWLCVTEKTLVERMLIRPEAEGVNRSR